jgi:hypothetical protein
MTLIKTNTAVDTSQDLWLQLTFEAEAAVLQSPAHPQMPALRIAFSHADMEKRFFPHGQLNPGLLERAIEWVEDHIQAAHSAWPEGAKLFTKEADLQTLASVSGVSEGVSEGAQRVLHVDAVEQTFSRLVMQAMGQAPHQEALPDSARFFASVVFVRELMHHLHFPQIWVH